MCMRAHEWQAVDLHAEREIGRLTNGIISTWLGLVDQCERAYTDALPDCG